MICKVSVPTCLDALGLEEEKWLFAACALMGTLALETVAVAPWKVEVKSTGIYVVSKWALGTYGKGQVAAGPRTPVKAVQEELGTLGLVENATTIGQGLGAKPLYLYKPPCSSYVTSQTIVPNSS